MKRFFTFLMAGVIIVSLAFGIMKNKNSYTVKLLKDNLELKINVKGLNNAKSFDFNENGDLYLAFEDTIKIIDSEGATKAIIKESNLNIYDLLYFKGNLYLASDHRIIKFNLIDKSFNTIIDNLPNNGVNNKINLLIRNEKLLFQIGSNTNAGIVNNKGENPDIATVNWTLNGENFGEELTGVFSPYSISTESGEVVKGEKIGNAAVYEIDLENLEIKLISHGIRSVEGWDLNSENKIIAVVSGITEDTVRNIKSDRDYIYEIGEDTWYGWPDYSGGDPITSPRFTEDEAQNFLIKNHIDKNPSKPLYQYNYVDSLKALAIDEGGTHLEKDTMIFSDNKNKSIYSLSAKGNAKEIIKLSDESNVEKIMINEKGIYILDSGKGTLYELIKKTDINGFNLSYEVWAFVIILVLSVTATVVIKNKKIKRI